MYEAAQLAAGEVGSAPCATPPEGYASRLLSEHPRYSLKNRGFCVIELSIQEALGCRYQVDYEVARLQQEALERAAAEHAAEAPRSNEGRKGRWTDPPLDVLRAADRRAQNGGRAPAGKKCVVQI